MSQAAYIRPHLIVLLRHLVAFYRLTDALIPAPKNERSNGAGFMKHWLFLLIPSAERSPPQPQELDRSCENTRKKRRVPGARPTLECRFLQFEWAPPKSARKRGLESPSKRRNYTSRGAYSVWDNWTVKHKYRRMYDRRSLDRIPFGL